MNISEGLRSYSYKQRPKNGMISNTLTISVFPVSHKNVTNSNITTSRNLKRMIFVLFHYFLQMPAKTVVKQPS